MNNNEASLTIIFVLVVYIIFQIYNTMLINDLEQQLIEIKAAVDHTQATIVSHPVDLTGKD